MKRNFFIVLFLLAVMSVMVCLCISRSYQKETTFYFPQIRAYMKVYKPLLDEYGYIGFSRDGVFPFSENSDFVRVYKSDISLLHFIFNPSDNKVIYVVDRWNNAKINQSNFMIEKISQTDTVFYEQSSIGGVSIQVLKSQSFEVFIEGDLQTVYYVDYSVCESPIRARPICK
ncbi:MAG: hypothetical protein SPF56_08930 [Bacteroidaceae bacterium]|nr:hypothetical protein [Prevotellaceae bacterium]MDY5632597.1 hypothetical protein [Bacteroidaceae bacterium]